MGILDDQDSTLSKLFSNIAYRLLMFKIRQLRMACLWSTLIPISALRRPLIRTAEQNGFVGRSQGGSMFEKPEVSKPSTFLRKLELQAGHLWVSCPFLHKQGLCEVSTVHVT